MSRGGVRFNPSALRFRKGKTVNVNWKWLLIGAAVGYLGAAYVPKLLNR